MPRWQGLRGNARRRAGRGQARPGQGVRAAPRESGGRKMVADNGQAAR